MQGLYTAISSIMQYDNSMKYYFLLYTAPVLIKYSDLMYLLIYLLVDNTNVM